MYCRLGPKRLRCWWLLERRQERRRLRKIRVSVGAGNAHSHGSTQGRSRRALSKVGGGSRKNAHLSPKTSLTTAQRKLRGIHATEADVAIRIRRTIVQVSREHARIRVIVPVSAAKNGVAPDLKVVLEIDPNQLEADFLRVVAKHQMTARL